LARGRTDELAAILEKASLWNSISLPTNFKKTLYVSQATSERRVSIFDIVKKGYRRTTFLMTIVWFSIILIYFGITLHMSSLGGNVYINTVTTPFFHPFFAIDLEGFMRKTIRAENK
jgi:MFS transporter, OCT family, solute carrier family 22 (organic cation transporter), member 4/5